MYTIYKYNFIFYPQLLNDILFAIELAALFFFLIKLLAAVQIEGFLIKIFAKMKFTVAYFSTSIC